jgi:predicted enzyme related to lactoylglutathione lyase
MARVGLLRPSHGGDDSSSPDLRAQAFPALRAMSPASASVSSGRDIRTYSVPQISSKICNRCEDLMSEVKKARAIGFNHIALEVGDIEEALAFYGRIFEFQLRGKDEDMAFIDLGDQFLALQKGRKQPSDDGRHFGLVVDDKDAVRRALAEAGVEVLPGPFLDFRDPWGNRVEIVGYDNIQFSKAPNVLRGMGLTHLTKNAKAIEELAEKGMAPD